MDGISTTPGARSAISRRLHRILSETTTQDEHSALEPDDASFAQEFTRTVSLLDEDLAAFAARDPACGGSAEVVFRAYSSYDAVVHHRLAHAVLTSSPAPRDVREVVARRISDRGKLKSGVDVHPAARIGHRFILDHAHGTVIGETCEIGSDCYVLGGATLGAVGIARNAEGKRHPTIGDRVQIGASAKVLGAVDVGDDVFIGPHAVVTSNIAAGTRVTIVNQLQLQGSRAKGGREFRVHGVGVVDDAIYVFGNQLGTLAATVVDDQLQPVSGLELRAVAVGEMLVRMDVLHVGPSEHPPGRRLHMRLSRRGAEVVVIDPLGLGRAIDAAVASASPGATVPQEGRTTRSLASS